MQSYPNSFPFLFQLSFLYPPVLFPLQLLFFFFFCSGQGLLLCLFSLLFGRVGDSFVGLVVLLQQNKTPKSEKERQKQSQKLKKQGRKPNHTKSNTQEELRSLKGSKTLQRKHKQKLNENVKLTTSSSKKHSKVKKTNAEARKKPASIGKAKLKQPKK